MSVDTILNDIQLKLEYPRMIKYINMNATYVNRSANDNKPEYDFGTYNKHIEKYINICKTKLSQEQLSNLYRNLRTLKIRLEEKEKTPRLIRTISLGYYNSNRNEITIEQYKDRTYTDKDIESVLFHELNHMSSTRTMEDDVVCGFAIPNVIGDGLNEGYTEYITKRDSLNEEYYDTDNYFIVIAKGIENIIGSDKMKEYYYNSDIYSVVDELSKYSNRKEVIRMLFLLDKMRSSFYDRRDISLMVKYISRINKIKLDLELEQGIIDYETYQIERAIKVDELKFGRIWPDETRVLHKDGYFVFKYKDQESELYYFDTSNDVKNNPKLTK